jgi:hypothetical protein
MMTDNRKYLRAKKQVEDEKGFYIHLLTYVLVNIFLVILNLVVSKNDLWFFWPMLGWGIGIFFHWLGVFGKNLVFGRSWEEKRIQKLMDKEDN